MHVLGKTPEDTLSLLMECHITEDESLHLLHELGHVVHALFSQTEMQHLAGKHPQRPGCRLVLPHFLHAARSFGKPFQLEVYTASSRYV